MCRNRNTSGIQAVRVLFGICLACTLSGCGPSKPPLPMIQRESGGIWVSYSNGFGGPEALDAVGALWAAAHDPYDLVRNVALAELGRAGRQSVRR